MIVDLADALEAIGHCENDFATSETINLLCKYLEHKSPTIRDAAGLGLANLDDPKAIPALEKAIEKEAIREMKEDLGLVLTQLQDTLCGREV